MKKNLVVGLGLACLGLSASTVFGAAITAGDLVIFRVGDGSAALASTATSVFLDEYTPAGAFVQSFAVPNAGAAAMTVVGNSTTEGVISRSADGSLLVFGGYRKDFGGTSPSSDTGATTPRVIGTLSLSGALNTSVGITDANGAFRSVATTDGSLFYAGTATGVRYIGSPGPASTSVVIDTRNSRQVLLSGSTLVAANGSTSLTGKVQNYGVLPTAATVPTVMVNLTTADAVNGIALFDLNPSIAGDDTLFALSTVENLLRKYTFDGTAWNASGSISAAGAVDLAGMVDGGNVDLFLTSGSTLFNYVDASGFGGSVSGALSTLATAGNNTAFRGLGFFPVQVPEPSTFGLVALGLAGWLLRRKNG